MILFLMGMTASGKTTIGRILANFLKGEFIDLDECIASSVGMSVRSFYAKDGKKAFQKFEFEELKKVMMQCEKRKDDGKFLVISAGGGLIENEEAISFLSNFCKSVVKDCRIFFLSVPEKILWMRILKKAKKHKSLPQFLKGGKAISSEANTLSFCSKRISKQRDIYRRRFLVICRKRMILFNKWKEKLNAIKIKCKGKKIRHIAKMMIAKSKDHVL